MVVAVETNLAAVLRGVKDLKVEAVPVPAAGPGEVVVAPRKVGICGSDVHFWQEGGIGDYIVRAPMVLGHEAAGRVVAVGPGVEHLAVGDRVAMEMGRPCGDCSYCWGGRYNLCPHMQFAATPPTDGSLCRLYKHPARWCYKLPDSLSWEEAAMLEPLSVGVMSVRRGKVELGQRVLVAGVGMIGLVTMMVARAAGAQYVAVSDVNEKRLARAKALGADETVLITTSAKEEVQAIGKRLQCDVCFECSGAEAAVAFCIYAARNGGTVVMVGMGAYEIKVPLLEAQCKEVDIKGVFRYHDTYPTAIALVANRKVSLKQLVTHRFKLEEAVKAFELVRDNKDEAVKVMIECTTDGDGPADSSK